MTAATDWTGLEPLPLGKTILLEASAGTGKTWQIEALCLRLVAEVEVPIDRILVITFTNAATAELRDRIRQRLVEARDALAQRTEPQADPILARLWSDEGQRARRQGLVATALSAFDLAPISTIHGFSQRMLDQLAFESGQEPGLELTTDSTAIIQQLVDDDLARVYAAATEEELELLEAMGWTGEPLGKLAKAMTGAVAPVVEPTWPGVDLPNLGPMDSVHSWQKTKTDLRAWLESPEGRVCADAVQAELDRKTKDKRVKRMGGDLVAKRLPAVKSWLDGPALRTSRAPKTPLCTSLTNLSLVGLEKVWVGPDEITSFEGYPLFERISQLLAEQDRLWPRALASFASRVRERVNDELLRCGQLTYDTMLSRLAERIASDAVEHGQEGPLARAIRSRFDVALVDEFQDTDGAQWPVMQAVFAHPTRRLVIIGDPKQAIYAFRGADVHVYLDAARVADSRATMRTNWRSDGRYVKAMNHLWAAGSGAFELGDVDYVEVDSSPVHQQERIRGLPDCEGSPRGAFDLRWFDGTTLGMASRVVGNKLIGQDGSAKLAAQEAARLLEAGTEIFVAREPRQEPRWSRLRPGDIAVLVRTNAQAEALRQHLDRLGIPSVSAGRGSVLASPVLDWLCAWLDAVADPGRDRQARTLATSPLFGWTALDLAMALHGADAPSDAQLSPEVTEATQRWDHWLGRINAWAALWPQRGFVRVFEGALDEFDVVGRVLGAQQGERYATDLRHLVELCHAEERRTRMGPSGLATWLRAGHAALGNGEDDAQALRLESDARAVQLVTVHKSKGLEYPIVLLPFGWADFQPKDGDGPLLWHATVGEHTEIRLNLELSGAGDRPRAVAQAACEQRQEQQRLLYVALTRARHHCVAWLGPCGSAAADTGSHALGRTALRQRDDTGKPLEEPAWPFFLTTGSEKAEEIEKAAAQQRQTWIDIQERLHRLAKTSGNTISWSVEPPLEGRERLALELGATSALTAKPWPKERSLFSPWQVSSYTAMVAGRTFDASEPQRLAEVRTTTDVASPPDEDSGAQVELAEPIAVPAGLDTPIATRELYGGTEVGTWAHAVLEHLDFQTCAGRDGRDLDTLVADLGTRHGVRSKAQHLLLAQALPGVLDTPLGGGVSGLSDSYCLRRLERADRLDELGFDLRLGAGNRWRRSSASSGLLNQEAAGVALGRRLGQADWSGNDWLGAVLERAAKEGQSVLPPIAGVLTGFIDLAFRVALPSEAGEPRHRYFVADYKTNRIAPPSQRRDSRRLHYTQPWMAWEMAHHGYHLQALLYTVALHRMLRQRVTSYAYDEHVGGHFYLFLRGMEGPDTPQDGGGVLGVYFDRWPAAVVLGLDAALSGVPTDEVRAIVAGETGGTP